MQDIQKVFDEIREAKKEMKEIRAMYKDSLSQAEGYAELVEKMTEIRDKKKGIEAKVQGQMGKMYEKYEELKQEVAGKEELLNDIAMSTLMAGQTVEVVDEFKNQYEPIYAVKFKKSNTIQAEKQEIAE